MKKLIYAILFLSFVFMMATCVFAETSVSIENAQQTESGEVSVECSIENSNISQIITVISCEYDDSTYSSTAIYTDQFTADVTAENKFSFNFLPADWMDANKNYVVRVGGYGIDNPDSMLITNGKVYKLGDINGDNIIDNKDAALLLKYISKIESLSAAQITAGDYNSDEIVDMLDVIVILNYMAE